MNPQTPHWAQTEWASAQLGDPRRTKRLIRLAQQRAAQPHASLPQACGSKAPAKAAYCFYDNDQIDPENILAPHRQATQKRLAPEKVVLGVQNTTLLDCTAHPATEGLGGLHDEHHRGLLMHTTLAVTPQQLPLGIIDQPVWARPAEEWGKRPPRKQRPIEEKESQKWLRSLQATAQAWRWTISSRGGCCF